MDLPTTRLKHKDGSQICICPEPLRGVVLHHLDGCKHVLIQPFVPDGTVVAFNVGVLLRLAGLDMCQFILGFGSLRPPTRGLKRWRRRVQALVMVSRFILCF